MSVRRMEESCPLGKLRSEKKIGKKKNVSCFSVLCVYSRLLYLVWIMSSILSIIQVVSVANLMALVVTRRG